MSTIGNFTYTRTTNATVLNQSGILQTLTPNNAPFAFDATGTDLGLVIEPARTNLFLRSDDFANASWSKANTSSGIAPVVTANDDIAPDGTLTADRIVFDASVANTANRSILRQLMNLAAGNYTMSFWIKRKTAGANLTMAWTISANTNTIFTVTSDWQRVIKPFTTGAVNSFFGIEVQGVTTSLSADVLVWGAQLELGGFPTSYIPTVASTSTRTAATCIKTNIGSQVGDTEGTIYTQVNTQAFNASRVIASIYDDANNDIRIGKTNTGAFFASYRTGGVETVNVVNATNNRSGNFKIGTAYNATGLQLFINGANGGSNTAGAVTGFNTIAIGHGASATNQFGEPISAFVLFDRRLSTNELTDLTT